MKVEDAKAVTENEEKDSKAGPSTSKRAKADEVSSTLNVAAMGSDKVNDHATMGREGTGPRSEEPRQEVPGSPLHYKPVTADDPHAVPLIEVHDYQTDLRNCK